MICDRCGLPKETARTFCFGIDGFGVAGYHHFKSPEPEPRMFYFGPWDQAGHYFFDEHGNGVYGERASRIPWTPGDIDGRLQPKTQGYEIEGKALLHQKDGWTAISFWDRSVDTRHGCSSTYCAEGSFSFDEMVEMAKCRFAIRWDRMKFEVVEYHPADPEGKSDV